MRTKLQHWRLFLEIAVWRHGLLWPLLLMCVLIAMTIWLFWVQPQKRQLFELNQRADAQVLNLQKILPKAPVGDAQAQAWEQIRETWPPAEQVDDQLASVINKAQKCSLVMDQGQFQYRHEAELNALKVTMNMPLRGSYLHLRCWVDSVLRDHPNLALDELNIKREEISSEELLVKARLFGWYRAEQVQAIGASSPHNLTDVKPMSTDWEQSKFPALKHGSSLQTGTRIQ